MAGPLDGATGLLVGGRWRASGTELVVTDKYTLQPLAAVQQARPGDVEAAVAAAAEAARHPMPPARRQDILGQASRLLAARRDEICAIYVAETGFTPEDAAGEMNRAIATMQLSAEESVRIAGEEVPVAAAPGSEGHKIGPAIAAGNAVVLKPAEQTPLCSVVILATGGFDRDPPLRARLQPPAQRASGAPPTNTGDALRIAESAGARCDNLGEGWWMPMIAIPGETLLGEPFYRSLVRERGLPRQIMVNAAGRRFADEAQPYNEIGKALHRQAGPVHLIFDVGCRERYPMPGLPRDGTPPAWIARGTSLAALAERIGVDPTALGGAVRRWNDACAAGTDRDFGRGESAYERFCDDPVLAAAGSNPCLGPIDRAPYYAVEVLAGTIGTKGGPVTDTDGVVLGQDGSPVAGLYAIGNAAAFWTADGYPGPGATLAVGMTMGYRAGRHAGRTVR
jgi:FAD binding domain/Aldehyde dehydrogenase family